MLGTSVDFIPMPRRFVVLAEDRQAAEIAVALHLAATNTGYQWHQRSIEQVFSPVIEVSDAAAHP